MSFLLVANFKSNKLESEVKDWIASVHPHPDLIVAPALAHLHLFTGQPFTLAAQDVSPFPAGSYTGAVNAQQLKDLGVTYCLVGHSERRHYFHETTVEIANKTKELLAVGITPIVCLSQVDLAPQSAAMDDAVISPSYFCFEPEDAIGHSTIYPLEDIRRVTNQIREIFHTERVMYGGSVNADNLASLLSLPLTGALVSNAALSPASFNQIIAGLSHVKI